MYIQLALIREAHLRLATDQYTIGYNKQQKEKEFVDYKYRFWTTFQCCMKN